MANLIYYGKINRQFWGKLIRQSTLHHFSKTLGLQYVTWGGGNYLNDSLNINNTFFHYDIRAG